MINILYVVWVGLNNNNYESNQRDKKSLEKKLLLHMLELYNLVKLDE